MFIVELTSLRPVHNSVEKDNLTSYVKLTFQVLIGSNLNVIFSIDFEI